MVNTINNKLLELAKLERVNSLSIEDKRIIVWINFKINSKGKYDSRDHKVVDLFKKVERKAEEGESYQTLNDDGEKMITEKLAKNDYELYNEIVFAVNEFIAIDENTKEIRLERESIEQELKDNNKNLILSTEKVQIEEKVKLKVAIENAEWGTEYDSSVELLKLSAPIEYGKEVDFDDIMF